MIVPSVANEGPSGHFGAEARKHFLLEVPVFAEISGLFCHLSYAVRCFLQYGHSGLNTTPDWGSKIDAA